MIDNGVRGAIGAEAGASSLLQARADQLIAKVRSGSGAEENSKIDKAGHDFESVLLASWLEKAEASFGSVPGGDGDDGDDGGKEQFQGMATQALAGALADAGGIGIAKMITDSLRSGSHGGRKATGGESASTQAGG